MTNHKLLFVLLGLFIFGPCFPSQSVEAAGRKARIWSDKSGKHELRAKFIDIKEGKARLERPNGDITRIPVDKLCEADQEYLRKLEESGEDKDEDDTSSFEDEEPKRSAGLAIGDKIEAEHFGSWYPGIVEEIDYRSELVEVRFKKQTGRGAGMISNSTHGFFLRDLRLPSTKQKPLLIRPSSAQIAGLKRVEPNLEDMVRQIADGSSATTVTPDPQVVKKTSGWKPRAVRLKDSAGFFENALDFTISITPKPLACVLHSAAEIDDEGPGRIEMVDLKSRKILLSGPTIPKTERLALSPSGSRLVTAIDCDAHENTVAQLDFWNISGKTIKHRVRFAPYPNLAWPEGQLKWLEWLNDDFVFTFNNAGKLLLWEAAGAKAVYELEVPSGSSPILSRGKKQIVISTREGVQFYDARSGDFLATLGAGSLQNGALAFSPSGKQLAVVSSGYVDVIDVTTGELTRSFPSQGISGHSGAWWIDEQYLMSGNGMLVHVPLRLTAWSFGVRSSKFKPYAGTQWLLAGKRMGAKTLSPVKLPPAEVIQAIAGLKAEDLLAVQPGSKVSLDVQIGDNQIASQVRKSLTDGLENAGLKINENEKGPLRLVAKMTHGESVSMAYGSFGFLNRVEETINTNKRIYDMQLLLNNKLVWQRKFVQSPPYHLRLNKGESISAAITRTMEPNARYFRGRLPAYVLKPKYQKPLGTSRLGE